MVSSNVEAVTECLPVLMKSVLSADYKLRDLCHDQIINNERAVSIQKNINALFLTFFKSWVHSDFVAKKFLTELNGFDFLLDRLFSKRIVQQDENSRKNIFIEQDQDQQDEGNDEDSEENDEEDEDPIMSIIMKKLNKLPLKQIGKRTSKPDKVKKLYKKLPTMQKQEATLEKDEEVSPLHQSEESSIKDIEQKVVIDDHAKSLKIIWSSDKQKSVQTTYGSIQWTRFKNGTKNRLYNYLIADNAFQYEYVMKFDIGSVIQLSEIQVGMLYNWSTFDPDCQYEPLSFILEGGKTEDKSDWKTLMYPVQDDGFKMNSITVYGAVFTDPGIAVQDSLEKTLENIGCKEARYLTMRLRKPIMTCLDQSQYVACSQKQKSYGLSYISVMGNQAAKPSSLYSYLVDMQKENSLEILSKFFSGEFTEAFELISEQPQIITKIQNAFDKLAVLLDSKANLIKPIFLAICSKNKDLGDWIMMNRLLSLNAAKIKKEQIKFLGDIISSNKERQLDKIIKLQGFIIDQIRKLTAQSPSSDGLFTSDEQRLLSRYLKLFNNKLREYSQYLKQSQIDGNQEQSEINLAFEPSDLDNIVSLMSESEAGTNNLFNALTSFALILLQPPSPFFNKTIEVNQYVDKLLSDSKNEIQNLLFSSIIATTNENAIKNILDKNKIEFVMENLKKDSFSSTYEQNTFQLAQIIFNCSKQSLFRDRYRKTLTFELYNLLKDEDSASGKLLKESVSRETVQLIVQTINDLAIGGEDEQEALSQMLKRDIQAASDKADVQFINTVIVPILHAEEKVPITISILDKAKTVNTLNPIYAGAEAQVSRDNFFFKTNILNKKQKETFARMFKQVCSDKVENFSKLLDSKWEKIFEDKTHAQQDSSKFRKFVTAVSNKHNVIILCGAKVLDQQVVFGGFTNKPFPSLGESWAHEFDYQVPFSEANFVWHYTPDKEHHFTMTHNKPFGYIYTDYEEGGALSISGDFFLISWSYEFQNSCGNIYDMKCIEDPSVVSQYNNMEIQSIEIWWCDVGAKTQLSDGKLKSELKKNPLYKSLSPFHFFRENLVFEVSKELTLSHLGQEILGRSGIFVKYPSEEVLDGKLKLKELDFSSQQGDPIIDLVILKEQKTADSETLSLEAKEDKAKQQMAPLEKVDFNQPILRRFEEKGGIFDLIKAAKAAVRLYQHEKLREMWGLWLSELESFSQLPEFFQTFCADHEKEQTIYALLEGRNDCDQDNQASTDKSRFVTQQEELHNEMVKYTYQIVSKVFEDQDSPQLRDECLKNGTFERFIERIGQLSSEKKRTKIDVSISQSETSSPEKMIDNAHPKKKDSKKKVLEQDKTKRKGVGYTTGVGTTWNVSEYLKSKEAKSGQAANIVNILKNMVRSKDWQAPQEIKQLILESALLPTLESAFRSGSLLEMAKDYHLNMAYLGFVEELSNHQTLIDLLMDIGDEYEPRQKEPVYVLLKKIGELSKIFLDCLPKDQKQQVDQTDDSQKPRLLAEKIQETNTIVQAKIQEQSHFKNQQSLQEILEMPLSEAYHKLLADLRFEYMSMKNSSGVYTHAYVHDLPKGLNPPVSKLVRLAQEIADLSNSLPCDYTNAIFCRVDQERVDVMKCLIMGASGTPYAHGAFIYDLFFENNYPNGPPKCQLVTTGGQTVRFNPNLYNNGKVCLSLLGTWRGSSTENWDPKLSTILQVLLSIQAIIMSSEVYFNEPGYEHEQGTPEGERKNEGYANIVRYCNIKFAMIDAIKNPPAGFEKVIKRSFYLKKNEILREVKEWVERAKVSDANYTGLVYDHNYHWAPQISPEGKYAEMMEAIYKELQETLESIPSPFEDGSGTKIERKFSAREDMEPEKAEEAASEAQAVQIEEIDVSYDPNTESKSQEIQQINIEDEKVKDRWSRYIGAMGIEAVAKQAESRVLICGLGPLGVEIAKNIVLAGCKELILYDYQPPTFDDLSGQFFLSESDVEMTNAEDVKLSITRAERCKNKLQELNFYVKVTTITVDEQAFMEFVESQTDLKALVLTQLSSVFSQEQLYKINSICRKNKTAFIAAYQNGLFSRVFNDFGSEFIVLDKDGEELQEVMIQDISYNQEREASVVTLLPGFKHKYQDGDQVIIKEVKGMNLLQDSTKSINNTTATIKVINPQSFTISTDVRLYSQYEGNGTAKQIKVPVKVEFKTLEEVDNDQEGPRLDSNLAVYDFEKMENQQFMHYIYQGFMKLQDEAEKQENEDILNDLEKLFEKYVSERIPKDLTEKQISKIKELLAIFTMTMRQSFPPLSAFLGGVVAQEIVKAITQKFMPINQMFYFDCVELFPMDQLEEMKKSLFKIDQTYTNRYDPLIQMIGPDLFEKIQSCKLFMIGAGAIGCELLKNYAMLGLGSGKDGQIIITDPDVIEVSNLNRQFLFREKHLRKPKSQTAAAAAIQMNPTLKGHIQARLDKIHDGTAHIYNESFFKQQTIVTNALDNVAARLYIDGKCVSARVPLIDSGTLGPKGHVQIVIPQFKTESYASQNDPEDNTEIPHCTLKMFPEEILHCIEWAKDIFGSTFTLKPQSFNKLIEEDAPVNLSDQQELVNLKKVLKTIDKKPTSFEDCIKLARSRFQKYFVNDIKQLLHVYPLDKQTKEGRPFWSLPKRPPHPVEFDSENQIHASFVAACACLIANAYRIPVPYDQPRSNEAKKKIAQIAATFEQKPFVPNDQKASQIESQVEKEQSKANQNEIQQEDNQISQKQDDIKVIEERFNNTIIPLRQKAAENLMIVEEFEKDNDQNYHIDFIHAMANIRAANYKLEEMDWINVKIKAGRIVPALATTTAAIAGLQTIELLKYLKGCKLEEHRNSFMNLAVPSLMMSEPAGAVKTTLKQGLEVTLWDRWEFDATTNKNVTLRQVIQHFENEKKLNSRDVFYGSVPLFMHALQGKDEATKALTMDKPLLDLIHGINKEKIESIDLTITFVDDEKAGGDNAEKKLEGVPIVRVIFKQ